MTTKRLAALLLLLTACAPAGEPPDSIPSPGAANGGEIRGIVRIVGSAPVNTQVVIQPEGGRAIRITGALRGELEHLAGIEVTVRGAVTPSRDPMADREVNATAYDIVGVNGRPVVMGEIVEVTEAWARLRTSSGEEILLTAPPTGLRVGQKIWAQGTPTLAVQTYGVIRP
jgi:hypothetical protein